MNRVEHHDHDRKYFLITPQLVLAKCENPLQFTLWSVVRSIAGDTGECYLSTEDLAALSMMSVGSASAARARLVSLGLLAGSVRRDAGYTQPVWHLHIPDLWVENTEWAQAHPSLKDRVRQKEAQKVSLQEVKASPGEGSTQEKPSGGEANKINNNKIKQTDPSKTNNAARPLPAAPTIQAVRPTAFSKSNSHQRDQQRDFIEYGERLGVDKDTLQAMTVALIELVGDTALAESGSHDGLRAIDLAQATIRSLLALNIKTPDQVQALHPVWQLRHFSAQEGVKGGKRKRPYHGALVDVAKAIHNGDYGWETTREEAFIGKEFLVQGYEPAITINAQGDYKVKARPWQTYNRAGAEIGFDYDLYDSMKEISNGPEQ
jgi:hypothetical protein